MPTTRRQLAAQKSRVETPSTTSRRATSHSPSQPPQGPLDAGNVDDDDDATPFRDASPNGTPVSSPSVASETEDISVQARNAKTARWQPWQDRFLITEALKHRPFLEARGTAIADAWERLSTILKLESTKKGTAIERTGSACRARFKLLMDAHKRDEARSLQKTGTNEEVNEHILNLTSIASLIEAHNAEREARNNSTKTRVAVETEAALQLREAAMKGVVKRDALTDVSALEGSTIRERQGQRRKRPRQDSVENGSSGKENTPSTRPSKRHRGRNAIYDVLNKRSTEDAKLLEEARSRDDRRQQELVDRLDKMTEGIMALTELTRQRMEHEREQQSDTIQMLLNAVVNK